MQQNIASSFVKLSRRIGRRFIISSPPRGHMDETPLRSELFSFSQMKKHGKTLAGLHSLTQKRFPERLLARLAVNESVLLEVRNHLIEDAKENNEVAPAGEWLLDNFYLSRSRSRRQSGFCPKDMPRIFPYLEMLLHWQCSFNRKSPGI